MSLSGPTLSSAHRWIAMRSDVSGVRNSCATVATRSFLSSSKRSRRVTSCRTMVDARRVAPLGGDAGWRAAGETGRPRGADTRTASSSPRARSAPRRPATCRRTRSTTARTAGLGRASGSPAARRADAEHAPRRRGCALSSAPSRSSTSTGSGRLSIAACAALLRLQQLAERAVAVLREPVGHSVELAGQRARSRPAGSTRARAARSPSPKRRAACASTRERAQEPVGQHRRGEQADAAKPGRRRRS